MLHGIFMAMRARHHKARIALRPIGVDQIDLARLVVVCLNGDVTRRLGLPDADVKADVLLLIDENIRLARRSHAVAIDEQGSLVGVEPDVEQGLAVGPQMMALRVSGMASRRSLPVARSRILMVKSSDPFLSTAYAR